MRRHIWEGLAMGKNFTAVPRLEQTARGKSVGISFSPFLAAITGVLLVTAANAAPVAPGVDLWVTPSGGSWDFHTIPAGSLTSLPNGEPSNAYNGGMLLMGSPLATNDPLGLSPTDTVVRRMMGTSLLFTCGSPPETVPIELVALSLVSASPITVTYPSDPAEQWNVSVCKAPGAALAGSMTIRETCANGGTYTADLPVMAELTFTRVAGGAGSPATVTVGPYTFSSSGHWSHIDKIGGLIVASAPDAVDTNCDGVFDTPIASSPVGPTGFFAGLYSLDCTSCLTSGTFRKPMSPEEEQLAAHGVFIANRNKPEVVGACCVGPPNPPGSCVVTGQVQCVQQFNGMWRGPGTTCTPNPCVVGGPLCGNGVCQPPAESPCNCVLDCGAPTASENGLCADGQDNDCDGAIDCADTDCAGDPACHCPDGVCDPTLGENPCTCPADCGGPLASETGFCTDGQDNDCDGAIDCADTDCAGDPACGPVQLCPLPTINPWCSGRQATDCVVDNVNDFICLVEATRFNAAGGPLVEKCACFTSNPDCGPVEIVQVPGGTFDVRCPGPCPPGQNCYLHFDDGSGLGPVSQGTNFWTDTSTIPPNVTVTCDCVVKPPSYKNWVIADDFQASCPDCTCDLNRDGVCDTLDDAIMHDCQLNPALPICQNADYDCDGDIDTFDDQTWYCLRFCQINGLPAEICCPEPRPRPRINKIRWYGSYLDPAFDPTLTVPTRQPDSWLIGLHSDLPAQACPPIPAVPGGGPKTPFDGCCTLEAGVEAGCLMCRPDGSAFVYNVNPASVAPHVAGDRIRICGYLDTTTPTTCQQGLATIVVNAVLDCQTKVSRPDRLIALWAFNDLDVTRENALKFGWDAHNIFRYDVRIPRGCLVHNFAAPDEIPNPNGPFIPQPGRTYWLSIQAMVGATWTKVAPGVCQELKTGQTITQEFWGWHTTPPGYQQKDDAYMGQVTMGCPPEQWVYEWMNHLHCSQNAGYQDCCDDPTKSIDMAFYLLQSRPGFCAGTGVACTDATDCPVGTPCILSADKTWWCQPVNPNDAADTDITPVPRPFPVGGIDEIQGTDALVVANIGLQEFSLNLHGPVVVARTGKDQVQPQPEPPLPVMIETEMLMLDLRGTGGEVLRLNRDPMAFGGRSTGTAQAGGGGGGGGAHPWPADSFFDVFIELDIPGQQPIVSQGPVRLQATIHEAPPGRIAYQGPLGFVQLVNKITGQPVGSLKVVTHFIPYRGGFNIHSDTDWLNIPGSECCEPLQTSSTLCTNTTCPNPTEICRPTGIVWQPGTQPTAVDCLCQEDTKCHLEFNAAVGPICVNPCPDPALVCTLLGSGTAADPWHCNCEPVAVCEPNSTGTGCVQACPVPGPPCVPQKVKGVFGTPNFSVVECACDDPNVCHVELNAAGLPYCVNPCPDALDTCRLDGTDTDGDGVPDLWECICLPPVDCAPNSLGTDCNPITCPDTGTGIVEKCQKKCVILNPLTGTVTLSDCDCVGPNDCHMELSTGGGAVVAGGGGAPTGDCVVVDDGSGTVKLPPDGCPYLSPDEFHKIVDGLPAGVTIEIGAIHKDFICNRQPGSSFCSFPIPPGVDCDDEEPNDPTDGAMECHDSTLELNMRGTGPMFGSTTAGPSTYVRMIPLMVRMETHTGPRTPGMPVQSFDTDMFRLQGQLPIGDPDFDLLKIKAGTDFGMPSPGHTTLVRMGGPGSPWSVDSFFDVFYEIDFIGAPGGPFAGMSGSTTGTIRMATKPFKCVGDCPPGTVCNESRTVNADGTIKVCCECEVAAVCETDPTTGACRPNTCPAPEECIANCARVTQVGGATTVTATDCHCDDPNICHLKVGALGAVTAGPGSPCEVVDNGSGSVDLPPVGCDYLSPDEVHKIIDGLPAGTEIHLAPIHKDFICHEGQQGVCSFLDVDCKEDGGDLGGEKECSDSTLEFQLTGTGTLAGWNRMVTIPNTSFETHIGKKKPFEPVQSFPTQIHRLFGQIIGIGDPDFDLLRVVAGNDFALPSPGHTTLTRLPNGNWAVDSFFDITYRIDFVGNSTSTHIPFRSGSTTGTIRMATTTAFKCTNTCPAGQVCKQTTTQPVPPDGSMTVCCDCVDAAVCEPKADGLSCTNNTCPPGVVCRPKAIQCIQNVPPPGETCRIVDCDCVDGDPCHPELAPQGAAQPVVCVGSCPIPPNNNKCTRKKVPIPGQNGFEYTCRCLPVHKTPLPDQLLPDKNRHASVGFDPPTTAGPGGVMVALRINPVDLQNPQPPNTPPFTAPDFSTYEVGTCTAAGEMGGCARWAGEPAWFLEAQDSPQIGKYRGSRLQCTPYWHDWSLEGTVHVLGAEIDPSSMYDAAFIDISCADSLDESCFSGPLPINTARWGDVSALFNPPSTTTQPDALDVGNLVAAFKHLPGALNKVMAQLQPNRPEPLLDVDATDILVEVDAFKGRAYPFTGPCICPSPVTCDTTPCASGAQCSGGMCVRTCIGGVNDGDECISTRHCRPCVGGTNDGVPCTSNAECPGGGTCPAGGMCGGGFCRDRCGRCSP